MRAFLTLLSFALAVLTLPSSRAAEPPRLRILTTLPPIYSWTTQVVRDLGDVENLLPNGVGPHNFSFRPRDLGRLQEADLIISNGLGIEDWLERAIRNTGGHQRMIRTSDGLDSLLIQDVPHLKLDPGRRPSRASAHAHDHSHGPEANPHVWLDPVLAMHGVSNILSAVIELDPQRADAYRRNANDYLQRLETLNKDLEKALTPIPNKAIVTYHDAFPYFVRRYGLELVGVVEEVPSVDPSPRYLATLMKVIRDRNVRVIFTEPQFNPRLARRLTEDLSIQIAELDVLETGPLTPDFYEEGMRRNLKTLIRVLGTTP